MNKSEFFDFEDEGRDFPYYKDDNTFSSRNLKIYAVYFIVMLFLVYGQLSFPREQYSLIFFIFSLLMILYLTKSNLKTFFKRPGWNDLRLVIVAYILYEVYYIIIAGLFNLAKFTPTTGNMDGLTWALMIPSILQIVGEEFFKIFVFLLILYFVYKKVGNRKKSIIIALLASSIVFGLLHYNSYPNIIQILLLQGLGSIFETITYVKTKNIVLPIAVHILINCATWVPFLLGYPFLGTFT